MKQGTLVLDIGSGRVDIRFGLNDFYGGLHCGTSMEAEYFAAGRRKITGVKANDNFTLTITFDNGEKRILDMKPYLLPGNAFEQFNNIVDFRRVYLDDSNVICWDIEPSVDSNVVWSNKVDLCPDTCYVDNPVRAP